MIPKLNMGYLNDNNGKTGCRSALAGNLIDAMRAPQEMHHSTPLRFRNASKCGSSPPFDVQRTPTSSTGVVTPLEDRVSSVDFSRRAEEVRHVLGGNVLQIQDVHTLQAKAIEVAELLLSLEEWYISQLKERTSYMEHRIAQLAAATVSHQSSIPTVDKLVVPSTIRSRQSSTSAFPVVNRPTLSLNCELSSRHTKCAAAGAVFHPPAMKWAKASTPDSCRHYTQSRRLGSSVTGARNGSPLYQAPLLSQGVASRRTASCRLMHKEDLGSSWRSAGVDRRNARSSRFSLSYRAKMGSDAENDELFDSTVRRAKKRRNSCLATSSKTPIKNNTPRRHHLLSGRLQLTFERAKRG